MIGSKLRVSTDLKFHLLAVVAAVIGIHYGNAFLTALSGSAEGGLCGSLLVGAVAYVLVCWMGQGSVFATFHPPSRLYELTRVKVLGEIKMALNEKYFGDKHWRSENIDAERGTALFVCNYAEKVSDKVEAPRTILLRIECRTISSGTSVGLVYEGVNMAAPEKIQPAELCGDTTEFLEEVLTAAERRFGVAA